ncbi:MAG: hypothetical protein GY953_25320 [bacterium]|nr:hypothetical protein [bacterium]
MSVKFQITLPEKLAAELKTAAAKREIPLAQFIRETMEEQLRTAKQPRLTDPLSWMDGLANIDDTDLSSRVDEILYGDKGVR